MGQQLVMDAEWFVILVAETTGLQLIHFQKHIIRTLPYLKWVLQYVVIQILTELHVCFLDIATHVVGIIIDR